MKYWNKDKDVRRRCWTKVTRPSGALKVGNQALKRWCQQQSSSGKFYYYYGTESWWFERSEDAVWFLMKWA